MGQQQLLLIVLGVIIIGVAVVVGINLYNANARQAELESIATEGNSLVLLAIEFYQKPTTFGGGGKAGFNYWNPPSTYQITDENIQSDRSYGLLSKQNNNAHFWFNAGASYFDLTGWVSQGDVVDYNDCLNNSRVEIAYILDTKEIQTLYYEPFAE